MARFSRLAAAALLGVLTACQSVPQSAPLLSADLLITGGQVYDGSGEEGRFLDVVITGERITYVGPDAALLYRPAQVIDAGGHVVAPGFIDPHTHAGSDLASSDAGRRANHAFAFQGVTTVMVGSDGDGSPDIARQAAEAERQGIGTNVTYMVGFGPVREAALGTENRAPTEAELAQMQGLVRQGMCEGAWGFSTGLYYVPQNYAATEEVIALARVAGELGGYYDTHMRDESTYNVGVTGALSETLRIGGEAGLPVHIAHIKALGPAVWGHSGRMIAMIEEAQGEGLRVTADQYPWEASGTRISNALVPRWALEGGLDAFRERVGVAEDAARIRDEMRAGLERRGGADKLLITAPLERAEVPVGKTLAEAAEAMALDPVEAAIAILREGDARVASFNMNPDDIAAFAYQDWVVTGSDGSTGHPRKYASFPKAYRDLVVAGEMPLARFIRRSSGQTADVIGLTDRGYLRAGYAADVVIFDPQSFAPVATYQSPTELSAGVRHLLVNGVAVISEGEAIGEMPGRALLKQTACN